MQEAPVNTILAGTALLVMAGVIFCFCSQSRSRAVFPLCGLRFSFPEIASAALVEFWPAIILLARP